MHTNLQPHIYSESITAHFLLWQSDQAEEKKHAKMFF